MKFVDKEFYLLRLQSYNATIKRSMVSHLALLGKSAQPHKVISMLLYELRAISIPNVTSCMTKAGLKISPTSTHAITFVTLIGKV